MDIKKIIREELHNMLKEVDPRAGEGESVTVKKIGSLQRPLEHDQLKSWEERQLPKVKNADVYYFNPAVEGRKTKEDKVFLAYYLDAGWSGKTDDTGKTRKDIKPKLINVNTPQNLALAQAIRNEIAAQSENYTEKVNRVGDIQKYVNALRAAIPERFPNKQKYPNLTKRLKAILEFLKMNSTDGKGGVDRIRVAKVLQKFVTQTQSKPAVKPAEQTAQPAPAEEQPAIKPGPKVGASTGEVLGGRGTSQEDPLRFATSQSAETFFQRQAEKITDKNFERNVYAQTANGQKFIVSILGGKAEMRPLQESKLIRKMIIQEVYKTLRK
jgi:hypothetical protein